MLWPLLPLLWAAEWAQGQEPGGLVRADSRVPTGFQALNLRYKLDLPPSVTVQEGLCLLVPCRVFHPNLNSLTRSVSGYWFRDKANINRNTSVATNNPNRQAQETKGRFYLIGDPRNNCSLDIRDAQKMDDGTYFFRVEAGSVKHSYLENKLSVCVKALTQKPDIHILGTLESGHPRNITCAVPWACERGTPPTFSWTWVTHASPLAPKTPPSSVFTLTPGPHDHGTNLTCRVNFPGAGVTVERTIQLNVSYALRNLTICVSQGHGTGSKALGNGSSLQVEEGKYLRLTCVGDSNPPAALSWTRGSLALRPTHPSDDGVLELPRVELEDHGEYVCRAQHLLGSQKASVSLIVKGKSGPGVVQGAIGGAGVTALLAVCLCLIFFTVKIYRKKSMEKAGSRNGAQPAMSTISLSPQYTSCSDRPTEHPPPAEATPTPGAELELHYASLSFSEPRPGEPQDLEAISTTEYAEIKIYK